MEKFIIGCISLLRKNQLKFIIDEERIKEYIDMGRKGNIGWNQYFYNDYHKNKIGYLIKIYNYSESHGYTNDGPFGEIYYDDVYDTLCQLIGYMKEQGLIYYNINVVVGAHRKSEMVPWTYDRVVLNDIEELKNIPFIGALSIFLTGDKEILKLYNENNEIS